MMIKSNKNEDTNNDKRNDKQQKLKIIKIKINYKKWMMNSWKVREEFIE